MSKRTEIKFEIELDDNNVPEKILWSATDGAVSSEAKAFILSIWDAKEQNTMRIDLWNKDMQVDEMKQLVHQTLLTLADSFERATNEKAMADAMRDFGAYYADKMKLMPTI